MGTVASRLEQPRHVDSGIRESDRTNGKTTATNAVASALGPSGSALTIIVPVVPDDLETLRRRLKQVGSNVNSGKEKQFDALETVHFLRWVILPPGPESSHSLLAFESNYDGTLEEHLDDLYENCAPFLHEVYGYCEGYPLKGSGFDRGVATTFLMQRMLPPAAFYVGIRNKPVRQILDEGAIHDEIQRFLDTHGPNPNQRLGDPDVAYDAIVEHLARAKPDELHRLRTSPRTPPKRRALPALWRALGAVLALVPPLPLLLWKEWRDPENKYDTPPETRSLREREDLEVQNQLTHLVEVKHGWLRQLTLKVVLWTIDGLARYHYNQGNLGGLTTIHYARWVVIDDGNPKTNRSRSEAPKRLLFFSNYDGSWEGYLGDFIDQAHVGLTAVWSNTLGFPKTVALIFGGATDEERFKAWARAHQIQTELWFSAYPNWTTPNIRRHRDICDGIVTRPATREERVRWLSLL